MESRPPHTTLNQACRGDPAKDQLVQQQRDQQGDPEERQEHAEGDDAGTEQRGCHATAYDRGVRRSEPARFGRLRHHIIGPDTHMKITMRHDKAEPPRS